MVPNLLRAAMLPWPAQTVFPVGNGISSFDGWSPRPTQSPQVHELLKRELETDGSQTCGYYNGIRESSITCTGSSICVSNTVQGVLGCCLAEDGPTCTLATSCVDLQQSTLCNDDCQDNSLIIKCYDLTEPSCNTRIYKDSDTSYSDFYCSVFGFTYTMYHTFADESSSSPDASVTSSESSATSITSRSSFVGSNSKEVASSEARSDIEDSGIESSEVASEPGSIVTAFTDEGSDSDNDSNTGTIVGGVFGGLALLGILAFGLVYLFLRHRRHVRRDALIAPTIATGIPETKAELHNESKAGNGSGNATLLSSTLSQRSRFELPDNRGTQSNVATQSHKGSTINSPTSIQEGRSEHLRADGSCVHNNRSITSSLDTNNHASSATNVQHDAGLAGASGAIMHGSTAEASLGNGQIANPVSAEYGHHQAMNASAIKIPRKNIYRESGTQTSTT